MTKFHVATLQPDRSDSEWFIHTYSDQRTGVKTYYRFYVRTDADKPHDNQYVEHSITLPAPPPPPPPPPLNMEAGWNTLVWPGATVSVVTALMGRPITAVYEWIAADGTWLFYFPPGTPLFDEFNTLTQLQRGHTYQMYATEAFSWQVRAARGVTSNADTADSATQAPPTQEGWTATVTCSSGRFSPLKLAPTDTEAKAVTAANWLINHPQGCGGNGTYTVSR